MDTNSYLHANHTMDWRTCIKRNQRDTFVIILILILSYLILGVCCDIAILHQKNIPLLKAWSDLQNGSYIPFCSLAGLILAAMAILGGLSCSGTYLLQGSNYSSVIRDDETNTTNETLLLDVVVEMKIAAGLNFFPNTYILDTPQPNAFASGFNEKTGIIVVTTGLLDLLSREELTAVIAHELTHIRHQDTRIILFTAFVSHCLIFMVDFCLNVVTKGDASEKSDKISPAVLNIEMLLIALRIFLPLIHVLVLSYLSKKREVMADAGCLELMRNNLPLGTALVKIHFAHKKSADAYGAFYKQTPHEDLRRLAYFYDPLEANAWPIMSSYNLFSTHPDLETRLTNIGFQSPLDASLSMANQA